MFSWSMLVAGTLWLLTLPVVLADVVLIYIDHHYGHPSLFGIGTNQWPQLAWAFGQPQIYAVVIPVLGVATDVVATLSGARQPSRRAIMAVDRRVRHPELRGLRPAVVLPGRAERGPLHRPGLPDHLPGPDRAGRLGGQPAGRAPAAGQPAAVRRWAPACCRGGHRGRGAVYGIKALDLHAAGWNATGYPPPYADGHFLLVVAVVVLGDVGWPRLLVRRSCSAAPPTRGWPSWPPWSGWSGGLVAGLPLLVYGFALKATGLAKSAHFLYGTSAVGSALLVVAVLVVLAALLTGRQAAPTTMPGAGARPSSGPRPARPRAGGFGVLEPVVSAEPLLDRARAEEAS